MKGFLLLSCLLLLKSGFGQLNMTQIGHLDLVQAHSSEGNDIWGYVDGMGNEYAIVGLNDGTSIVDISNPASPVEVFYEPGSNSVWRDIKTFGNYAYVTTEALNGLLIIDLSSLPNANLITTSYYFGPSMDQWQSAHNLYIDENGVCYIFGANRDAGGCIMLDVATNPTSPIELGKIETWYAHDGVARGDTLYMGHINDGFMSMYNVADKSNPILLGTQNTPGNFAHNLWFSDDGDHVYTTDEIPNGFIGSYNVSDPQNITELDKTQSSPGDNVIPHNTHFINNYIVTSYYRDGVVIHDVSNPSNLVEVGNFDTSPLSGGGFNGCWGVYPWLPSGNIIASDIEAGLFILGANYQRGCYLEGQVTDALTNAPISNANIEILATNHVDNSNLLGNYQTGVGAAATYTVEFSKFGYVTETVTGVVMTTGNTTTLNVQLTPLPSYDVTGTVTNNGFPLSGVQVLLSSADTNYLISTDGNGDFIKNNVIDGNYNITVGMWSYVTQCSTFTVNGAPVNMNFDLEFGYYDDFSLDFGWTAASTTTQGVWEREDPVGTSFAGNILSNPEDDVPGDCGDLAYVTGNGGGNVGFDDVDNGEVVLSSPIFDGTLYTNPSVNYYSWWFNNGGSFPTDDTMYVYISNGSDTVELRQYATSFFPQSAWHYNNIQLNQYLSITNTMQLIVVAADYSSGNGHLVEGGIDGFSVTEFVSVYEINEPSVHIYPNPFQDEINLDIENAKNQTLDVRLLDITGKIIHNQQAFNGQNTLKLPSGLSKGSYLLVISNDRFKTVKKVMK